MKTIGFAEKVGIAICTFIALLFAGLFFGKLISSDQFLHHPLADNMVLAIGAFSVVGMVVMVFRAITDWR